MPLKAKVILLVAKYLKSRKKLGMQLNKTPRKRGIKPSRV